MMRKLMGTRMMGRMVLFLVMLLGCSGLSLAQNTADVQHGKHRKRMKERLAIADSLRLELRKAADEGRMFQWGDSLLRERLGKGQIDSARYMKLQARLQRADRHLHKGDQLLEAKYKKISFDTLYIGRPDARWTIKLRTNLSGAQLKFNGSKNQIPFNGDLRADYRGTLSVAVAYRGIAVGLAVNPAKLAGKSKDNEFNLNSYSNKFGFDVVLLSSKTYHGSVETNGVSSDISKGQLKQKAVNLNFYYAFNGRRFSFPAAFSQSYVQKRSAGSFMLGMSMDGQYTNAYDVMTNSGVGNAKMRIYALGIGAGYGYNLVVGRHWLFHLSTLPTFDVLLRSYIETDEGKVNMHYRFPSVIIVGRGAAVYSWKNKFFGATMVFNYSSVGDENRLQIKRAKERLRLFYGFRF
ncbi:MAG: DUF4421 family protein [Prevotella sp.]|nr:DUF4421 family protein [Prevotella sp.]